MLSQLKSEYDQVNLFFNSMLADEISIEVIRNGELTDHIAEFELNLISLQE